MGAGMAKTIQDLLNEADVVIEKRASAVALVSSDGDDEAVKLAESLENWGLGVPKKEEVKTASHEGKTPQYDINEKVAHAIAIIDTVMNLPLIQKLEEFEKVAEEKGFSKEEIDGFVKKAISGKQLDTTGIWAKRLLLPAAGAAGAGGYIHGKKKGKKKGYEKALKDVNQAFEQYNV